MADLSENLRIVLDNVRSIPAILGLRSYTILVRVRTWSGIRAGLGTKTDTDTDITVADGYAPRVRQLTQKDVFASGGIYSDQDFEITITPAYTGGGNAPSVFDVPYGNSPTEIFFIISGPGLPAQGALYRKKSQTIDSNLTYQFIVSKTGEKA